MIGQGMHGFIENKEVSVPDIDKALKEPTDKRIFVIESAFRKGYSVDKVHELTKIDKWFLEKLYNLIVTAKELESYNALEGCPPAAYPSGQGARFLRFPDCARCLEI